jgi:hypothetical protein
VSANGKHAQMIAQFFTPVDPHLERAGPIMNACTRATALRRRST